MRRLLVVLVVLLALVSPFVFAQDSCGTDYFSYDVTASVLVSSTDLTPDTADGESSGTGSTPSEEADPPVSYVADDCLDDLIFFGIRWNRLFGELRSDEVIVNTGGDIVSVVNIDGADSSISEVRWYEQAGGATPAALTFPELEVDHDVAISDLLHTAVSGDTLEVVLLSDGDLHIGRFEADLTPVVWQLSFIDDLDALYFIDYNPVADVLAALLQDGADLVIYTIDVSAGTLIDRVAVDSGSSSVDIGHGIRVDDSGDVYVAYSAGFPGPYHLFKLSGAAVVWDKILEPGVDFDAFADDNLVALGSVYVGGNFETDGAKIFRLSESTGAPDFELDLGADIFLNGLIARSGLDASGRIYFYGQDESSSDGMAGMISDSGPTNTWFNSYDGLTMAKGSEEGNFGQVALVGFEDFGFGVVDSVFVYLFDDTGAVGNFAGAPTNADRVDIAGAGVDDTLTDVVLVTLAGFFDCFTAVGNDGATGDTLVYQRCARVPCGDGDFDVGEECDGGGPGHNDAGCDLSVAPCDFDCTCPICGDSILHSVLGEECDDGNNIDGDGCSANCVEEGPPDKSSQFVLFDLLMGHNLMFSKVLDLSHISKDNVIQDETKVIQKGLIDAFENPPNGNPCQVLPVLFAMPANLHPYGKLNEINALNGLWLFNANTPAKRAALGIGDLPFASASLMESDAESLVESADYLLAAQEKCCAYNQLRIDEVLSFDPLTGICNLCGDDVIAGTEECEPPGVQNGCDEGELCTDACTCTECGDGITEFPEECDDGANGVDTDQCFDDCTFTFCGDGFLQNPNGEGTGGATGVGDEVCDDGNNVDGDGCQADCTLPRPPPGGGSGSGGGYGAGACCGACEHDPSLQCRMHPYSYRCTVVSVDCSSVVETPGVTYAVHEFGGKKYRCLATPACDPKFGVLDTFENPACCVLLPDFESAVQPTKASGAAARLAECVNSDDCMAGFVCQNGACVQPQRPAQPPKVVSKPSINSNIAIAGILLVVLAAIVFVMLNRRGKPKPEVPSEFVRPVEPEKPAKKPEPKSVPKKKGYEPSKVESDLADLEKSYKKIEDMLKSMRRNFKNP